MLDPAFVADCPYGPGGLLLDEVIEIDRENHRVVDGWIGYGGRIHSARFKALAKPGPPLRLECRAKQLRESPKQVLARYEFRFAQDGTVVYEGDQTALWMKVTEAPVSPST